MWAGQQRYMWIDLTAGPLLYGPHTSGEGLVSEFSIPRLDNYQVDKDEGHDGHHFAFCACSSLDAVAATARVESIAPLLILAAALACFGCH
jgi:hypothetical protein